MNRSHLYYLANLPSGFRDDSFSESQPCAEHGKVAKWVAEAMGRCEKGAIASPPGSGLSLVGPAGSGKTHWGCVMLRFLLHLPTCIVREDYCDPRRFDYLELMSETLDFADQRIKLQNLRQAQWVFLDNLYLRPPSAAILSALLYRRDWGKTTWLGFRASRGQEIHEGLVPLWESFQQVNASFLLRPPHLP